MMKTGIMPKLLFSFLFLTGMILSAGALDFDMGGTVFNSLAYEKISQEEDPAIDELATLALWFDLLGASPGGAEWSFGGQARYEYTDDRPWLFDLDYLRFNIRLPDAAGPGSLMEVSAGRFFFSDPTGMILTHAADGASLKMLFPRLGVTVSAGYTGLILNPQSDIRMTSADWSDEGNEEEYFFGPSRLFVLASFRLPEVGKIYGLNLLAAGQFDLAADSERTKLHTQYLGAASDRRYGSHLYETLFLVLEAGEMMPSEGETRFMAGFIVGGHWRYLQEEWLNSALSLRVVVASPDYSEENSSMDLMGYIPMNQPDLGVTVSPLLTGLGMLELGYSFTPMVNSANGPASRLQPYVNIRGYFRTRTVTVGWMNTDPDSDSIFLGTEFEGGARWRIFSDIGLGLTGAVFVPAEAPVGAADPEMDPLWSIRFDVSVSF